MIDSRENPSGEKPRRTHLELWRARGDAAPTELEAMAPRGATQMALLRSYSSWLTLADRSTVRGKGG